VRAECAKVLKMSLFATHFPKSVRLDEFEQAQSQNAEQVGIDCVSLWFGVGMGLACRGKRTLPTDLHALSLQTGHSREANCRRPACQQIGNYLKDLWSLGVKNAVRASFKDVGKGWFNLQESNMET
jgi:hypothetical protein